MNSIIFYQIMSLSDILSISEIYVKIAKHITYDDCDSLRKVNKPIREFLGNNKDLVKYSKFTIKKIGIQYQFLYNGKLHSMYNKPSCISISNSHINVMEIFNIDYSSTYNTIQTLYKYKNKDFNLLVKFTSPDKHIYMCHSNHFYIHYRDEQYLGILPNKFCIVEYDKIPYGVCNYCHITHDKFKEYLDKFDKKI